MREMAWRAASLEIKVLLLKVYITGEFLVIQ